MYIICCILGNFEQAENIKSIDELISNIKNLDVNCSLKFRVLVNASAKSNSIDFADDYIRIRIKERAIEGKANVAIIEYLSDILNIPKKWIEIVSGHTSRIKTIQIKKC